MEKQLNTRQLQKYDIESNWNSTPDFIPKAGEVIIYSPDENTFYPRMKIGNGVTAIANLPFVNKYLEDKIPTQISQLENDSKFLNQEEIEGLFKNLGADKVLRFYCVEDVTVIVNGISTTYPANSNAEIKFLDTDVWEIIPTSNNSIMALNSWPGALGTYYPWLEGVK